MKYFLSQTLLFVLFNSACPAQNSDTAIIRKLNSEWLNAIIHRDSASLANILADDFILINPSGQRRTKADNLSNLHVPGQSVTSITIDNQNLRMLSGNIGVITVWTTNYINSGKEKMILKICYTDIYQKRNKKWQAVAGHVTLLK